MQRVRAAAVAGSFYPANPGRLRAEIVRMLEGAPPGRPAKALIAPHAGYIYSGAIAASAFKRVTQVERVVLLGPSHHAWLDGVALPDADVFATPLGEVPIEAPAGLRKDRAAHEREHSLEVEVPFLQVILQRFRLVPLAVGSGGADVLDSLWGGPETLIVVSSDLSHYLPYAAAKRVDAETAEEIVALNPVESDAACGAAPVNALLAVAKRRQLAAELIDLRNSGDTAGDKSSVVGYGAFAFYDR